MRALLVSAFISTLLFCFPVHLSFDQSNRFLTPKKIPSYFAIHYNETY